MTTYAQANCGAPRTSCRPRRRRREPFPAGRRLQPARRGPAGLPPAAPGTGTSGTSSSTRTSGDPATKSMYSVFIRNNLEDPGGDNSDTDRRVNLVVVGQMVLVDGNDAPDPRERDPDRRHHEDPRRAAPDESRRLGRRDPEGGERRRHELRREVTGTKENAMTTSPRLSPPAGTSPGRPPRRRGSGSPRPAPDRGLRPDAADHGPADEGEPAHRPGRHRVDGSGIPAARHSIGPRNVFGYLTATATTFNNGRERRPP